MDAITIVVLTVLAFLVGYVLGGSGKREKTKIEIPYTDVGKINSELENIRKAMVVTRGKYDVGEQLNTIVKILSRAFPPE